MRAPAFWYSSKGILSFLLSPLGWLYGKGGKFLRTLKKPQHFSLPIISMGSIICGGSGKTPTAIALARLLQKKGIAVHFVTRGYKGALRGPVKVDSSHTPAEVGDEPLLLAQQAPTWVAKKRPLGVQKAIDDGAHLVILDDGHQTSSLHKDLSFVVVNSLQGFGKGSILPAGPLREDLTEGLKRTDALIEIGEGERIPKIPVFRAKNISLTLTFSLRRVIAFCGLGFPQQFYRALEGMGAHLVATESFPDHYVYTEKDLVRLQHLAKSHQALLVTTRKDWVKFSPSWQDQVHVLDNEIQFEDPKGIYEFILRKIPHLKGTQ